MTEVVFLLAAEIHAQELYTWLAEVRPGAAELFDKQMNAAVQQLRSFPRSGPVRELGHRRLMIAGFPYALYYKQNGNRVMISAVLDVRQDPDIIRRALGG